MDHIWEANVSGTAPTFPAGLQVGYPTETPVPTVPGVWWYHQITEEIRNVIVAAGETPNADALNQLLNAINILAKNSPTINGSVTLANYTANSVPYINASNVLVTEAGFTFDGTTMVVPNVTAAGRVLVGNGNASAPSIDRIDSSKGYSNENTRIVCRWYNMAKGELSDEEMYKMCKLVVDNYESK